MNKRRIQIILLCEDQQQEVFMRRFLKRHGYRNDQIRHRFSRLLLTNNFTVIEPGRARIRKKKDVDFIDVYAEIREDEREAILHEMTEQEDTAMLAQYIRDKGFQEGWKKGELAGELAGELKGGRVLLERLLTRRFGPLPDWGRDQLGGANMDQLDRWADRALEANSIQAVLAE